MDDDGLLVTNVKSVFANAVEEEELVWLVPLEVAFVSQKKLQKQGLKVSEQLKILTEFGGKMFGTDAAGKLDLTLEKNPALKIFKESNAKYLYAPLTSCAIERLFSLVRSK